MQALQKQEISINDDNTDQSPRAKEMLQHFNQELMEGVAESLYNSQKSLINKIVELMLLQEAIAINDKEIYAELQSRNNVISKKLDHLLVKVFDLILNEVRKKANDSDCL